MDDAAPLPPCVVGRNQQGDACVEVCDDFPGTVPVRDSKNTTGPPVLRNALTGGSCRPGASDGSLSRRPAGSR
ncbi:DUF397 domain-containing protein [Streptomyces sp. RY43-2]|uniref:DUF397 domain-containing protein n=1 Tax=Streptomyces macrolidinus TaxID=2952607 RepID=A0ABT0ZJS8_9ACTN|nr:DUF397 domain-containing protein [Streptomyces macrolidinus]